MHDFRIHPSHHNPHHNLLWPDPFAVEGSGAFDAKGIASNAGHDDTDPDWQPV